MSSRPAKERLRTAIGELRLSPDVQTALYELAVDPHGVEHAAAPGMVASLLDCPIERANGIIQELLGKNFVIRKEDEEEARLLADYQQLGIDEAAQHELVHQRQAFEDQGKPHSKKAMSALGKLFRETEDTIYLGLEVTTHHVFKALRERAESGKRTIFLMPKRRHVPDSRRTHYDEILTGWIRFIKDGPRALRQNVAIRITASAFPELYTTALSAELARLNLRFYSSKTTRRGDMFEVSRGTSLYDLVLERYRVAMRHSRPLWSIWPFRAMWHWVVRCAPLFLVLTGIVFAGIRSSVTPVLSAFAVGVAANIVAQQFGATEWALPRLFRR